MNPVYLLASVAFAAAAAIAAPASAIDLSQDERRLVAESLKLKDFTLQPIAPVEGPGGSVSIDLVLGGEPVTLRLAPHSIRADDFRVVEVDGDGAVREIDAGPISTYRGDIAGRPGSRVAAGFVEGRLAAWIDTGDGLWMTQSLADVLPAADAGETVVYAADDLDMSDWFCAVEDVAAPVDPGTGPIVPRGVSDCPTHLVTIEITADRAFSTIHHQFQLTRIEAMVNMVSNIYEANLGTRVELIGIRTFAATDPWSIPNDGTGSVDAGALLDAFTSYVGTTPPVAGTDRDFAHLASGREFAGATVGLAWVGTVCQAAATGVNQWNGLNLAANAVILAHEKGHNWGAGHDGSGNPCPSSGFIMSPGVCLGCTTQPNQFSSCSIAQITPNLSRPCVAQFPPVLDSFGAVDDNLTIPRGTAHLLDVLLNDVVCVNGDAVRIGDLSLSSATSNAGFPITIVRGVGPDGRDMIDYAPHVNFSGTDTFTYNLINGEHSASATVTVNVSPNVYPALCDCDCFSEYRADNGPIGTLGFSSGVQAIWMNQFNVEPGADQVLQVTVVGGSGGSIRFVIWDDPNNDGQPHDAVPIATSPVVQLNGGPTSFTFGPVDVGAVGDSFFVGAQQQTGEFPISYDGSPNVGNRSWFTVGSINIGQHGNIQPGDTRYVIRAVAGADLLDCNGNNIVDVCDIANYIRPDVNGNGVPDECDPVAQCLCEFDNNAAQIDVFDLLAYLDEWFAGSVAADVDGAAGVDVFDLLAFLDCWFPGSAGNPCP